MDNLLPPNATALERNAEGVNTRIESVDLSDVPKLWNPDTCPAALLPWLAWAERIDEWSSSWSLAVQRAVIKAHRQVRRTRGTKQALVDAISAFGGTVSIKEWFEYSPAHTPGTCDIVITGGAEYVSSGLQESMMRAIERVKRKSVHYTLGVGLTAACELNITALAQAANYKRMSFTA